VLLWPFQSSALLRRKSQGSMDSPRLKVVIDEGKKVAGCNCKHSANKPFCDGSHSRLSDS